MLSQKHRSKKERRKTEAAALEEREEETEDKTDESEVEREEETTEETDEREVEGEQEDKGTDEREMETESGAVLSCGPGAVLSCGPLFPSSKVHLSADDLPGCAAQPSIRLRIDCATEVCKLHERRAQALPA